jgi:hypothetical protein
MSNAEKIKRLERELKELKLPESEQKALQKTRDEAAIAGATIRNLLGGLSPSVALGIFRRDEFRCKRCGTSSDIGLHHKGIKSSVNHAWRGKQNTKPNLVVLCHSCHGAVHDEDNEITEIKKGEA